MAKKKRYCYFNGKITALDKIKISPYDLGILRGYGVFDAMCTKNGKPFLLNDHWKRLQNSARELNLKIPVSRKEFQEIVTKLLKLNGFKKSYVRTILTGGISKDAFTPCGKETFFILMERFCPLPSSVFSKGANIITLEYQRDFPRAKTTAYIIALKKQKLKEKKKSLEIVYLKRGRVLEASTSNIFIVKNKVLVTPKDDILLGTTRNLIVKLARQDKLKILERKITLKELFSADEVFLTATNKDIVPVVKVDGKKIGDGKVGKITKELMKIFQKFAENY